MSMQDKISKYPSEPTGVDVEYLQTIATLYRRMEKAWRSHPTEVRADLSDHIFICQINEIMCSDEAQRVTVNIPKPTITSDFNESGNATYEMTFGDARDPRNKVLREVDTYEHALRRIRALMEREVGYDADVMEITEPPWNVACIAVSDLADILTDMVIGLRAIDEEAKGTS